MAVKRSVERPPGRSRQRASVTGRHSQSSSSSSTSFSLKTSPSTFLSSPSEDALHGGRSHVDHVWSVGGGAYDSSPASSVMMSSPSSALDAVRSLEQRSVGLRHLAPLSVCTFRVYTVHPMCTYPLKYWHPNEKDTRECCGLNQICLVKSMLILHIAFH